MSSYEISCTERPSLRSILHVVGISSAIVRLFCEMNDSSFPPVIPFVYPCKGNRRVILRCLRELGFSSPPQLVPPSDYRYRNGEHPYRKCIPAELCRSLLLLLFPSLSSNVPAFQKQSNLFAEEWSCSHLLENSFLKFTDEWRTLPCFSSTNLSFYLIAMNLTNVDDEKSVLRQAMALNFFQSVSFSYIPIS